VRVQNIPAIRLYEKFAFRCVGRRRNYYDRPVEDALLYELAF
jgi:ribosomal-protein-alanine N-acetyltransferase